MPESNIELATRRTALVERVRVLRSMATIPGEGAATELEESINFIDDLLARLSLLQGELQRSKDKHQRLRERVNRALQLFQEDTS